MKLTFSKIALQYGPGDVMIMPLKQFARKERFAIKRIDGLDPPEIDVALGQKIYEGSVWQGSRPQDRELTITLETKPDYRAGETHGDLRSQLYGLLAPKFGYNVTFGLLDNSNNTVASINGRVKSVGSNPFDKAAGTVQIVMECFGPYLKAPRYTMPTPTLQRVNPLGIDNPGNAPSGFNLQITLGSFVAAGTSITFSKATYGEILRFYPNSPFRAKDVIVISTEDGTKSAFHYRPKTGQPADGNIGNYTKTNLLPVISSTSAWFQLHGGLNTLLVRINDTYISQFVVNSFNFQPRYWGV